MTRTEHLLTILIEECQETAQRATKALRFGLREVQQGQGLTNARRIAYEYADLLGVYQLLQTEGLVPPPSIVEMNSKMEKIEKYLKYSDNCGTLS
jgi:hypothetical protein